ncbi:hypothetical protein ACSEOD_03170 [Pseudomonas aeruginosa]
MTDREVALEKALGAVVAAAVQLGIHRTLLGKAQIELFSRDLNPGLAGELIQEAINEIELAAQNSASDLEGESSLEMHH